MILHSWATFYSCIYLQPASCLEVMAIRMTYTASIRSNQYQNSMSLSVTTKLSPSLSPKIQMMHPPPLKYSSWLDANVQDRTGFAPCYLNARIWLLPTRLILWETLCHDWRSMEIYLSRTISRCVQSRSIYTTIFYYSSLYIFSQFIDLSKLLLLPTLDSYWSCLCVRWTQSSAMARSAFPSHGIRTRCYLHGGDDNYCVLRVQRKVYCNAGWKRD